MPAAVILAAGQGSRLGGRDDLPKPLTELLGISLLERTIRTAYEAGVRRFVVITGHRHHEVAATTTSIAARFGVHIDVAESRSWELGNGASALASQSHIDRRFFLLMADHVYPVEFLARLIEQDDGVRTCALVVDHDLPAVHDLAEATKVRTAGSDIVAIGKALSDFDAADTGIFLCRPALFDALRDCATHGRHLLGEAVQLLAARGEVSWVPSDGQLWQDVDTPEDLTVVRGRLLAVGNDERLLSTP
ncbi:MAG TPA: NTP transferase domain-containing protein [Dehalococcoidia bacterium]|nr:NTP transferase domain-containing protein [Dehalococcoidia bacterium]